MLTQSRPAIPTLLWGRGFGKLNIASSVAILTSVPRNLIYVSNTGSTIGAFCGHNINKLLTPNATTRQLIKILIKFFNRHRCKMNAKNVPFKPDFLSNDIAKLLRIAHLHFQKYNFAVNNSNEFKSLF